MDRERLWYGGDWNPEQWPERVWREDVALMRDAGVNLVSVGVFAWSRLEPAPGRYEFDWLDRVMDALHDAGIGANLATPTASPPPWFSLAHPDALPVTAQGVRLTHGSRDTYCAAAPAYRQAAVRIAAALAGRYAHHPALAMWHVHNEYGTVCHCDHAAAAFRGWLRTRYDADLDALNAAWGAPFWSQLYGSWEQVFPPRATQYLPNPHQALDFRRFWSDELRAAFREQRDRLRTARPDVPITTNFAFGDWVPVDHRAFAEDVDLVALDAYPDSDAEAAFLGDLARHWAGGGGWLLMEQAPAAEPGGTARRSLSYVARGSVGVMFFQWRASAAGAEQFHPALVPHAGPDTRAYAEARELGAVLPRLAEVAGARVAAEVAIAWDAESWWATQSPHLPAALDYLGALQRAHRTLWRRQLAVDFAGLAAGLAQYRLVLVPSHYLASDAAAQSARQYVAAGGHLVVWFGAGIADPSGRIRLGGYPGAFRDLLGVRVTELHPLPAGAAVALSGGSEATVWTERVELRGAEPVLRYAAGALSGAPAVTRHATGAGTAWYVSTCLSDHAYDRLVDAVLDCAGVRREELPPGVDVVRRHTGDRSWLFAVNHTGTGVEIPADGTELVSGKGVTGRVLVPAGGFVVVR